MLFETQCKTNISVLVEIFTGVQNIPAQKCHFSVYVDVGECTDPIQHKDRGDFQVTIMLHLCRLFFSFSGLHLQHIHDLKGGCHFF